MELFVKNLLFTLLVPGTVAVYLPLQIAEGRELSSGLALATACLVLGLGAAIYAWCVWDFASFGRGTPAPIDAPTRLVVRGLYRYTRNPMYVGVLTVILGWSLLFQAPVLALYAAGVGTCFHLFVVLYEERHLRQEFGGEFESYCARVPRWLPRPGARSAMWLLLAVLGLGCERAGDVGTRSGSPVDDLPAWIRPLVSSGLRPDWSPAGDRLVYLDALVGDVHELELATGQSRLLTGHFPHDGFTRARYLASGDLLLCGPGASSRTGDEQDGGVAEGDEHRWKTELWFLPRDGTGPAQRLEEPCFEGPAVSRRGMQVAWTRSDYPDSVVFARSEIWTGRVEVQDGAARLVERRKRVDRADFFYLAFLETQDFRPPDEKELLFTAYAYKGGEVMGIDLESGEIVNYSQDWAYDEAEGVFPDGKSIAVERELDTYTAVPVGDIDIWRLSLDGSGAAQRLTGFTRYAGYGANNPVISPDGRWMAFGLRIKGGEHGNAQGIMLYDFDLAPRERSHP